jgi:hypothetical protein
MSETPVESVETGTDVSVRSDPRAVIAALASGESTVFSTFAGTDHATKVEVLKALTDTESVDDHLGEVINLANVVVQSIEVVDAETGEATPAPRIILVDADGTAYAAVSTGLLRSLENIFGILGQPSTWPAPLPITVVEEKSRRGFKFFTVKVA